MTDAVDVPNPRPALQKLNDDQREVVASAVDGVASRRDVVEWCQRAIVATLGELDDDLFADVCLEKSWLAMLMADHGDRAYWSPRNEPVSDLVAEEFRRRFVAREVAPACTAAHRVLRWKAVEYVDGDEAGRLDAPDPAAQHHPGMRPALSALESRQERELRRLLDGYRDEAALVDSLLRLNQATYAEHERDLVDDVVDEQHTREHLLADSPHPEAVEFRERFAAVFVLPAFNRAARKLAERSGELVESESGGLEVKSL